MCVSEAPALAEPELSTVLEDTVELEEAAEHEAEAETALDKGRQSPSATKRRKRGAQGRGCCHPRGDLGVLDDKLNMLAEALQKPARRVFRHTCRRHTPPVVAVMPLPPAMLKKASRRKGDG
jgi:hypothetical protein